PEVVEAAAVPVPDKMRGEAIRLFVVVTPESTLTSRRILQHCRRSVSNHLIPREIVFLSELPKNSSGKIVKATLLSYAVPLAQVVG
ncbi:MAG: long-chain-fatty-acid--CoA ligase, partial [Bryobacteraceae bacterium]|nr:long-chain-fatty-acid--CoA ligase [Bryobacteraceae bacterium]